jgi:hypothetical protein
MVGKHAINLCKTALLASTVGAELRARLVRGLIFIDAAVDTLTQLSGRNECLALRRRVDKSPEMNLGVYIDDIAAAGGG